MGCVLKEDRLRSLNFEQRISVYLIGLIIACLWIPTAMAVVGLADMTLTWFGTQVVLIWDKEDGGVRMSSGANLFVFGPALFYVGVVLAVVLYIEALAMVFENVRPK